MERKVPRRFGAAEWNAILQIQSLSPRRQDDFSGTIGEALSSRAQAFGLTSQFSQVRIGFRAYFWFWGSLGNL